MKRQFTPVKSSAMTGYHYDRDTKDLRVQFPSGKVYRYPNVSLERATALEGAASKGNYLNDQIIPHHIGRPE